MKTIKELLAGPMLNTAETAERVYYGTKRRSATTMLNRILSREGDMPPLIETATAAVLGELRTKIFAAIKRGADSKKRLLEVAGDPLLQKRGLATAMFPNNTVASAEHHLRLIFTGGARSLGPSEEKLLRRVLGELMADLPETRKAQIAEPNLELTPEG